MSFCKEKKAVLVMLMVFVVSVIGVRTDVYAAGLDELGQTVDGSLLTDDKEATDSAHIRTRGNFLSYGVSSIVNHGQGKLGIGGNTFASYKCDELLLSIILEQKTSKGWLYMGTWDFSVKDQSSLDKGWMIDVEPGYFYRVRGIHIARRGGEQESLTTASDGIWISGE